MSEAQVTAPVAAAPSNTEGKTTDPKITAAGAGKETAPKTVQETIAELEAADFEKLMPIKDEKGQVQKLKLKDVVKRIYSAETQAKRAKESLNTQLDASLKELVSFAKKSPQEFLAKIGIDPYDFSEATLKQKVEMLQMSPEQKRLTEAEQELKKYKEKEVTEAQQREIENRTKQEHEEIKKLDLEMASAFKEMNLPKNKFFFQWATALMHDSCVRAEAEQERNGFVETEPLNAKQALAIVKDKFPGMIREYLKSLDPNQVKEFVSEELLGKIREADIARVQNQTPASKKASGTPTRAEKEPKVFTSDHEWRDWVDSKRI